MARAGVGSGDRCSRTQARQAPRCPSGWTLGGAWASGGGSLVTQTATLTAFTKPAAGLTRRKPKSVRSPGYFHHTRCPQKLGLELDVTSRESRTCPLGRSRSSVTEEAGELENPGSGHRETAPSSLQVASPGWAGGRGRTPPNPSSRRECPPSCPAGRSTPPAQAGGRRNRKEAAQGKWQ